MHHINSDDVHEQILVIVEQTIQDRKTCMVDVILYISKTLNTRENPTLQETEEEDKNTSTVCLRFEQIKKRDIGDPNRQQNATSMQNPTGK